MCVFIRSRSSLQRPWALGLGFVGCFFFFLVRGRGEVGLRVCGSGDAGLSFVSEGELSARRSGLDTECRR